MLSSGLEGIDLNKRKSHDWPTTMKTTRKTNSETTSVISNERMDTSTPFCAGQPTVGRLFSFVPPHF